MKRKKKSGFNSKKKTSVKTTKNSVPPHYNPGALKSRKIPKKEDVRLNKYIANAGVCSRRDADKLIADGKIKVNGNIVTEMGFKVTMSDKVQFEGQVLKPERSVFVLLNKPKDFITTVDDPQERKTVMELIDNACDERIYPVGRLDRNTTGLLLFTNDGDLAKKLTHPSRKVKKIYEVSLNKPITKDHATQLASGLELEDGLMEIDELVILSDDKKRLGLEIHSGKNRIVRRMFEALGYEVVKLDRTVFAGLTKKDLPRGKWRYLSEKEVIRLKHY